MKTVIITGTSHGLGYCLANAFLKAGWHVVGTGRSTRPDNLDQAIEYQQFDGSDENATGNFWQGLNLNDAEEICLVNNAGGFVGGGLLDTKPEDFLKQMKSNYFTAVYMTRGLIEKVDKARIINVISNSALEPNAKTGAYGAAKSASRYFFQTLQKEYSADKYKITNLYPSNIATAQPDPKSIEPNDLADFIRDMAESKHSYFAR